MTDPTADTSAIEAALPFTDDVLDAIARGVEDTSSRLYNITGEYLLRFVALARDNARLTAALAEAEEDMAEESRELNEELALARTWEADARTWEVDAATGRAVGRRLRDGWKVAHAGDRWWWMPPTYLRWDTSAEQMPPAEAAYLASLEEGEGT